jgi:hypothetical protein
MGVECMKVDNVERFVLCMDVDGWESVDNEWLEFIWISVDGEGIIMDNVEGMLLLIDIPGFDMDIVG